DTTFNRVPHFRRVTGQRIPLRVVTSPGAQWQREIAEEVNEPFTPDQALLFRAALLHQDTHCILILSSHHTVSDGFSLIFLLRDILLVLSGHDLGALPLTPSREILLGAQQRTSTEPGLPSSAARRPLLPHVEGIKLTAEQTSALARKASPSTPLSPLQAEPSMKAGAITRSASCRPPRSATFLALKINAWSPSVAVRSPSRQAAR
ncbi:MAG TPA: condensation domain-containing protein, partial [Edaphobacter sp.]|nr:condensation domain-containing protein [Edaphobacter sp.]